MGISIKTTGGGTRVTIDGKPVTEKMELKESYKIDSSSAVKYPQNMINNRCNISVGENYLCFVGGHSSKAIISKFNINEGSFKELLNKSTNFTSSASTIIRDIAYVNIGQDRIAKVDLEKETVTEIEAYNHFVFSFKGNIYIYSSYYSPSGIYKLDTEKNTFTRICDLQTTIQYDDEIFVYKTDKAIYIVPRERTGLNIIKFDGSTATNMENTIPFFNGDFNESFLNTDGMQCMYSLSIDGIGKYVYIINNDNITKIGIDEPNPLGLQRFKDTILATYQTERLGNHRGNVLYNTKVVYEKTSKERKIEL